MSRAYPLDFQISGPSGNASPSAGTVALLLHGRGSDMNDLQGLRQMLPADWTVVTPRAPHGGLPWGYGPGWAWYRYVREDQVVLETLEASLTVLNRFIEQLPDIVGGTPSRLVLGGFSQGGTMSIAYAARHPDAVDAVWNFSGFVADGLVLPAVDATPSEDAAAAQRSEMPPVYWGHGLDDSAIPHRLAIKGRAQLVAAGVELTAEDYPIGHWIVPEEVEGAVRIVQDPDHVT